MKIMFEEVEMSDEERDRIFSAIEKDMEEFRRENAIKQFQSQQELNKVVLNA